MANTAAKKQAAGNTQALKYLRLAFAAVNAIVLAAHFLLHRPASLKPYVVFSIPSFLIQLQLERMGRPKYDSKGGLVRPGENLSQAGLTEWLQDVVYVTWACDLLVVLTGSHKCWWLLSVVPGYASFMIYTKFLKGRIGGGKAQQEPEDPQTKSRRQEKLEKRGGNRTKFAR